MLQLIIERYTADPYWVAAAAIILLMVWLLFTAALIRNFKKLSWYYLAAVLVGLVLAAYIYWYPMLLEALVAYRSDWSLIFLLENISLGNLLTQFVFYTIIYSILAILILVALGIWCLLTFRWKRAKNILEQSLSMSWFVLLFAVLSIVGSGLLRLFVPELDFLALGYLFEFFAFIFALQFFLRLIDNAYLKTPNLWLEFCFATGLVWLGWHLAWDWLASLLPSRGVFLSAISSDDFLSGGDFFARELFFDHLFSFFLIILSLGFLGTFFVRALFAADEFVARNRQKMPKAVLWLARFLFNQKESSYAGMRWLLGMLLSLGVALTLIILTLKGLYLVLIPAFFAAYFLLFYLLDQQHDMQAKGQLLEKR